MEKTGTPLGSATGEAARAERGPFTRGVEQQRTPALVQSTYAWEHLEESPLSGIDEGICEAAATMGEGPWQEASAQWSRRSGHKASPPGSPREGTASSTKRAVKTPGQASYYSPLAQRVIEENKERKDQEKTHRRRMAGYPPEFELVTYTPLEELKRTGLWHILEPVEDHTTGASEYVQGVHSLFEEERAEMVDIFSAEEEVLLGFWQFLMEQIADERLEVPEILRA